MANSKRMRMKYFLPGVGVAVLATAALANVLGATSLAALLGTSGMTMTTVLGPGKGQGGVDMEHLAVYAYKDTSSNPPCISGTISYSADNALSGADINQFKFEVRDPSNSQNPWLTVLNVTAPDSRIVNSAPLNTFQASFTIPDMSKGYEYRASVWNASPTQGNPFFFAQDGCYEP